MLVLEILKFCPDFFGCVREQLDKKVGVNFKIHDVTTSKTHNYNTQIGRYLKK